MNKKISRSQIEIYLYLIWGSKVDQSLLMILVGTFVDLFSLFSPGEGSDEDNGYNNQETPTMAGRPNWFVRSFASLKSHHVVYLIVPSFLRGEFLLR